MMLFSFTYAQSTAFNSVYVLGTVLYHFRLSSRVLLQ